MVDAGTQEVLVPMRRPVIAGIAIGAATVLVAGTIAGVVAYQSATSKLPHSAPAPLTATQLADYQHVVESWPYPFAPGDAVPKSPPPLSGNPPSPQSDRAFISFFYQCSWVNEVIGGRASARSTALISLRAWNDLPVSVSSADNSDGAWKATILLPAENGNLKPLEDYFKTCKAYQSYRTKPGTGIVVNKPLPNPLATPSATPGAIPTSSPSKRASVGTDMVGKYHVEIPVDNGPENYATGTVTLDSAGHPAAYVVASGDVIDYIADRFGFFSPSGEGFDYLNTINQVRRGGYPWTIYAGDTLNLSAYTILNVGSIDGKVLNEAPPDPMPAQR
ncbi:hypothetical protein ACFPJ4_12795 [Lysinimonas soli]|uniref:LysM domain-containing protein n=1 Tax=Lysinimonas soli TaxID=1074233 RepID=A0ABW0NRH1_9MICO